MHAEQTSMPRLAVNVDESAVLLDDTIRRRQPHPATLAAVLRRKERLEDAFASFRIHAHSSVADGQDGISARRHVGIESAIGFVELGHLRLNSEPAAVRHGIAGVQTQIHEHLLDLRWISFQWVQVRAYNVKLDILAKHFVEKTGYAAHYGIQIDGSGLQHLSPRECQQFPRKVCRTLCLLANFREALRDLRITAALLEAQFRPAQDGANNIVEIVRHAARELANGFKLLRML